MEQTKKLPFKLKFSLAVGDFSKSTLQVLNAFFLLWFYTDVAKIPAEAATVIMLIARIWDAINDPMMGIIVDKTNSKYGRCRFWLRYMSLPAGICIALSYWAPPFLEGSNLILWIGVTYIFQGMLQTITNVPFNTLLARVTDDPQERVKLGQWRGFGSTIASTLVSAIALPFVKFIGGGDQVDGFFKFACLCGALYFAGFFFVYIASKGYEPTNIDDQLNAGNASKSTIGEILKALFTNKYALFVCLTNIIFMLYNAFNGASMVYYATYNLQNDSLMSVYATMSSVISFIAVASMGFLGRKLGNSKTCALASAILIVSFGVRFFTHDAFTPVLYLCWGIEGIGCGLFAQMIYQCAIDSTTYGEWKNGIDNSGTIMSVYTFAQKFGLAAGGVVASWLLGIFNYQEGAATQSQAVLDVFFHEIVTLPLILFIVLTFMFLYLSKFEKKLPEMKKELEERKAKAHAEAGAVEAAPAE